jgi:hypothetical protein
MKTFKSFPETDCPRANALVVEPFCVGDFFIMEIWKFVSGSNEAYEVSNLGNVKSNLRKKGLLNLIIDAKGYAKVNLSFNGIVKKMFVHRLVVQQFEGIQPFEHVDHINGNSLDNRLENLRKCSLVENLRFDNVKKNKTSKYVGVSKFGNKWRAQIQVNKKKLNIGLFFTQEQAYQAYKSKLQTL